MKQKREIEEEMTEIENGGKCEFLCEVCTKKHPVIHWKNRSVRGADLSALIHYPSKKRCTAIDATFPSVVAEHSQFCSVPTGAAPRPSPVNQASESQRELSWLPSAHRDSRAASACRSVHQCIIIVHGFGVR